ncbi:MAG TPA: hypothetical protein VNX70_03320 [Bryobacteraceae bacterium]|nr:hypothetical protein [Bryobacteraceae bacterium]
MAKRVVLAGLLGGVAMFMWMSLAHVVLPLGEVGVQEIQNEPAVLTAMQAALGEKSGLFVFPSTGAGPNATSQEKNAAMQHYDEKLAANPSGLLVYHPPGETGLTARRLVTEFLTELLEAFLVVFLLAQTHISSFGGRLAFVTVAGVVASLGTNISYWNWYGFPTNYTAVYILTQIMGFMFVGAVAGAIMRKTAPKSVAVAV